MAADLTAWLNRTARELGFAAVSVSQPDLSKAQNFYHDWIQAGFHGEMDYMARNADKRFAPAQLVPETVSIISVAMPCTVDQARYSACGRCAAGSTPEGSNAITIIAIGA